VTTLNTLQQAFQDYLSHQNNHTIETLIAEGHSLPKTEQLEIYFNAYRLRLLEILAEDFPKLKILMGEEAFDQCGLFYIAVHPSKHFSVRYFGQHLNDFLRTEAPYSESPYLAEMAAFEWAFGNTLDAQDTDIVKLETLQTIPPEKWGHLQFTFHPSLQILSLEWDIPQLWQTLNALEPPRQAVKQSAAITWIAWRKELRTQYRSLTHSQVVMLNKLQSGMTFADLCEILCETIEEEKVPQVALEFIQQCMTDNIISKISY
jgi:hypothetical protein